jgi:hypothetical protein
MEILEEAMASAESTLAGVQADLQSAQVLRAFFVIFQSQVANLMSRTTSGAMPSPSVAA